MQEYYSKNICSFIGFNIYDDRHLFFDSNYAFFYKYSGFVFNINWTGCFFDTIRC